MIGRILVALDGSPRAPLVFEAASEIAARFGAKVVLFRAIAIPPEYPPAAATEHKDLLPQHLTEVARTEMQALAARAPSLAIELRIEPAVQAWRAILRAGDELDVDLIVLGSHGYHGLDRLLGTTAGKVANLAHRNVLVVHAR
jgi:universal stress protein F